MNIPFTTEPFPCDNCLPTLPVDLRPIEDSGLLAAHSIAPASLRPFVVLALNRDPDLNSAIEAAHSNNVPRVGRIGELGARKILHRQATARCSNFFSPAAAAFVSFGGLASIDAAAEERRCLDDYLATGRMPPAVREVQNQPGS